MRSPSSVGLVSAVSDLACTTPVAPECRPLLTNVQKFSRFTARSTTATRKVNPAETSALRRNALCVLRMPSEAASSNSILERIDYGTTVDLNKRIHDRINHESWHEGPAPRPSQQEVAHLNRAVILQEMSELYKRKAPLPRRAEVKHMDQDSIKRPISLWRLDDAIVDLKVLLPISAASTF